MIQWALAQWMWDYLFEDLKQSYLNDIRVSEVWCAIIV
jgi:hypothetical protein